MHLSRALTAKLAACILAVTAVITPSLPPLWALL